MVQDWCIGIELVQLTRVPACQCCANFGQCITNPLSIENKNSIDREKPIENYWLPILTKWRSMQCQSGWNKKSLWSSLPGYQWSANWVPMDCQLSATRLTLPIDSQGNVNLHPIICHLIVNWMPIDCLSDNNWNPIWCHLRSNWIPIKIQSDANLDPIGCQLRSNWL